VQVVVAFQTKFFGAPWTSALPVLPRVSFETREGVEVLQGARRRFGDGRGGPTIHGSEIVPIDTHIYCK